MDRAEKALAYATIWSNCMLAAATLEVSPLGVRHQHGLFGQANTFFQEALKIGASQSNIDEVSGFSAITPLGGAVVPDHD